MAAKQDIKHSAFCSIYNYVRHIQLSRWQKEFTIVQESSKTIPVVVTLTASALARLWYKSPYA